MAFLLVFMAGIVAERRGWIKAAEAKRGPGGPARAAA
jgi:hypothetical protein